jgi:hypothetical protein
MRILNILSFRVSLTSDNNAEDDMLKDVEEIEVEEAN